MNRFHRFRLLLTAATGVCLFLLEPVACMLLPVGDNSCVPQRNGLWCGGGANWGVHTWEIPV